MERKHVDTSSDSILSIHMLKGRPLILAGVGTALAVGTGSLRVDESPRLPRAIAGQFVGVVGSSLVVAGGSWWTAPPSEGGKKIWDARIETLETGGTEWHEVPRLPRALAYGGAVSLKETLVLAGGEDDLAVSRGVWGLEKRDQSYYLSAWAELPTPLANFSMAATGDRVYVLGGQSSKNSLASAELWSLRVDAHGTPDSRWRKEASLPRAGLILSAAAGGMDRLYIVGRATLVPSENGVPERRYLREAWSFDPATGWKRLPNPTALAVAAPAVCERKGDFLLIGGDDGHMAGVALRPGERHPGFGRNVMRYTTESNQWISVGELPHRAGGHWSCSVARRSHCYSGGRRPSREPV